MHQYRSQRLSPQRCEGQAEKAWVFALEVDLAFAPIQLMFQAWLRKRFEFLNANLELDDRPWRNLLLLLVCVERELRADVLGLVDRLLGSAQDSHGTLV